MSEGIFTLPLFPVKDGVAKALYQEQKNSFFRLLQKQSAATKSKYSARGPEATSINTQVRARNSFN